MLMPFIPPSLIKANFYDNIVSAGLTSGLENVVDIGASTSYGGSGQTITNISGSATDDWWFGVDGTATTDDPTFTGTAGNLLSTTYLSYDGGDYNHQKTQPAYVDNFHKNNADLTIWVWMQLVASTQDDFCGNAKNTNSIGISILQNGTDKIQFQVNTGGGAGTAALSVTSSDSFTTGSPALFILSLDEATGAGGSFMYDTGAYLQVASADTFDGTYTSPSASAATAALDIGGVEASTGGNKLSNGARVYGWGMSSVSWTKAQCDSFYDLSKSRFGL